MIGFLSHTGFAHGGNGFEGVVFLLEALRRPQPRRPGQPAHGLDLTAMASAYAREYGAERAASKEVGAGARNIPCVNHPVFRTSRSTSTRARNSCASSSRHAASTASSRLLPQAGAGAA